MPPPPETFSKIKYVPDPYKPAITIVRHGDSTKGIRQMCGSKGIKSKFNRLYEGEAPVICKGGVNAKKVVETKFLTSDGFKYSSNMKVSNNRGDYTSTFTKNIEHIPITKPETEEMAEQRRSTKKLLTVAPRNICTSPYREEVFNKIPYVTPSVDKAPEGKKKHTDKMPRFSFTKKNDLFVKEKYMGGDIAKSKSESDLAKSKRAPTIDCGSFRPSSPGVNLRSPISGAFGHCNYVSTRYDDKERLRATVPDKLHPLKPSVKVWVS